MTEIEIVGLSYNKLKLKNYLRRFSSNIGDENSMRMLIFKLFYYDIDGIPIAKIKQEDHINWDNFPRLFKLVPREDIIEIYNKSVKTSYYKELKILDEKDLDLYDIKPNTSLEISLNTFRPIYKDNWKELSEEINNISFDKQKSYYSIYLKLYLKLRYFPDFNDFIKYIYNKYQSPVHKDIQIIFENIEFSYKSIKEYIKINDMNYNDIKEIIIKSTNISNRIDMEKTI